ncbi:hypothetical protein DFH06DRAFT_1472965 [Mycena polygramma]|nr:hypothetical protein DFH06DRAFT_1472965 [Mycena polygramma]
MRLIFILHVSTALLWTVFAAPALSMPSPAPATDLPSDIPSRSASANGPSDSFQVIELPMASHAPSPEEAANFGLELDQKTKGNGGPFENGCVIFHLREHRRHAVRDLLGTLFCTEKGT